MFYSNERAEKLVEWFRQLIQNFYSQDAQMITMEMNKGILTLLSVPQEQNVFCSQEYTVVNFIPKTLLRCFMRISNVFLLMISLIMIINPLLSPYLSWIIIVQISSGAIIFISNEAICDFQRRSSDKIINQQSTKRGAKNGGIEEIKWQDINIGDVLLLNKGDIVPADIIVLDTGQVRDREAVCMVDSTYCDGKSTFTKKKSCYLTQLIVLRTRQKSQFAEYRKLLTGRLEYEVPNGHTNIFRGRLKLKKDPKVEFLSIENLIFKGSTIKQTSWLFGLVVYVGSKTKNSMSSKKNKAKCSHEENLVDFISLFMITLILFFSLISIIVLLARSDDITFALSIDKNTQNGMKIFNLLILYSQFIPANIFMILDIINIVNKFRFKLHRPQTFSELGSLDYMLLDKTGTITTSYYKLDNFQFGSQVFNLNHDQLFNQLTKNKRIDEEEDVIKFASIFDQEYYIPMEYDTVNRRTSQVIDLMPNQNKKVLKSVKTSNNQQLFSQVLEQQYNFQPNSVRSQDFHEMISLRKSMLFQHKKRNLLHQHQSLMNNNNDEFLQMINQYKQKSPQLEYAELQNENALYYDCFMKCLILCHEARPVYLNDVQYESFSKNEEIALGFARLCGYQLESFNKFDSPDAYLCKIRNQKVYYDILGLNQYTENRNVNSIVVQSQKSGDIGDWDSCAISHLSGEGSKNKSLLICKGDYDALKIKLQLTPKEKEELEQHIQILKMRGVRMILYGTRVLNEKETEEYKKQFNLLKNSLTNQDDQLEQLANQYEQQLSIIGMIGFKEELKQDAYEFIQATKSQNIHIWLLSGDQEAQTISCAQALQINESIYNKYLQIQQTENEKIWFQLNTCIGIIQSEMVKQQLCNEDINTLINSSSTIYDGINYQKMLKFTLLVNGNSLNIIQKDNDLMSHFRFLAGICKNVIGYNLNQQHKEMMCKIIRNFLKKNVIAIGDGYNDQLMMQYSNISVEVINNKYKNSVINTGDVKVQYLGEIKELLLQGKIYQEKLHHLILYCFFAAGLMGMSLFFFNWFCYFTSTSLHGSLNLFLYVQIFIGINALLIGLFSNQTSYYINQLYPSLYIDGQIRVRIIWKIFLLNMIESFLTSAFIFYMIIYQFNYAINDKGHTNDLKMESLGIIYCFLIIITLRVSFILNNFGKLIQLKLIFILVLIIIFHDQYKNETYQIFTRYNCIISIIQSLILSFTIRYLFQDVIRLRIFPSVYEQLQFRYEQDNESINNQQIINQYLDQQINISHIISQVFKDCKVLSPYIQEILNPGDTKITEMKLSKLTLTINDLIVEQKFLSIKLQESLNNYRLFLTLLLIYFGIYCFIDFFINHQRLQTGLQYITIFCIFAIIITYIMSRHFQQNYYVNSHMIFVVLYIIKIAFDWLSDDLSFIMSSVLVVLFTTNNTMNINIIPIFVYNIIYIIQLIVRIILVLIVDSSLSTQVYYNHTRVVIYGSSTSILLMLSLTFSLLYTLYKTIQHRRTDFLAKYQIEQDNLAANDILSILVPKFVRNQIQLGSLHMQEAQNDVSILFCYICDFDSIMKEEGRNVVLMLDSLFRIFDNLCLQHGVQKIETVGYTYMAATGIKASEINISPHMLKTEKTMRLVNMAFDMMEQIKGRQYGKGNQIEMKIGIHVGRVIAGLIGHHKPQFSLIGDPVNQTSRVGSTGEIGAITLSEEAFKQAKHGIRYYHKKQKEAKGLGLIDTYQVFKIKPNNYQIPINQQRWQQLAKLVIKQQKLKKNLAGETQKETILQKIQNSLNNLHDNSFWGSQKISNSPKTQFAQSLLNVHSLPDQRRHSQLDTIPIQSLAILDSEETQINDPQQVSDDDEKHKGLLKPNLLLMIPESQNEIKRSFYNIHYEQQQFESHFGLLSLWIIYFVITLLNIIIRQFFGQQYDIFFIRSLFLICLVILLPIIKQTYKNIYINWIFYIVFQYGTFTIIYGTYLANNKLVSTISMVELIYLVIVVCSLKMFTFVQILIFMLLLFTSFLALFIDNKQITHYYVFYLLSAIILSLIGYYKGMSELIEMYNNLQLNEQKKVKQISLVSQLLPTHSYLKMKNNTLYNRSEFIDDLDDVTLLFADIKGFTEYSHTQSPEGVVKMLRNLFTEFDKLCLQFNVYKMYTIGDCYVVMGFQQASKRNPIQEAINTVKMGFSMIEIIMEVRKLIDFPLLNMRIGIHTGSIIGGIIGTDIVRYDIYGQDVSIANKMESSGTEGHVQISETTKLMIERAERNPFVFQFKQNVELAKFNTSINGYLVEWERKKRDRGESHFRGEPNLMRDIKESQNL
ncbi:unnamed protein product [Paramecium sonneborni]|uniref:guanylate cyclase n=1 Tax=Paramecium sonneborni TaxID=65129 RepID=A0A8S1MA79_9CILI|nr:unnamed protein product [Paramecium sonneborni]